MFITTSGQGHRNVTLRALQRQALAGRDPGAARLVEPPFITGEPDRSGTRRGCKFTLRPVRFDGYLDVVDADELRLLVKRGVGRAKSYGNGMLMLARTRG